MKDNKKYIDKVIGSLVRGTKIDYDNNLISPPFISSPIPLYPSYFPPLLLVPFL